MTAAACESSAYAPVAVFAFRRAQHLKRTLASLAANSEAAHTEVYIFCDGPRHAADQVDCEDVRKVAESAEGFAICHVIVRDENRGLARSIIQCVTELLGRHDKLIILEDDLELAPTFLKFMNEGLSLYRDTPEVASIHGYCYPVNGTLPESFFLRGADCWGWATWRRAWMHFNDDGSALLRELKARNLCAQFDFDDAHPYTAMLEDQVLGLNQSWAIRWHASCFLKNMVTLYPGVSLVHNIGNDASGTHARRTGQFAVTPGMAPASLKRLEPVHNRTAARLYADFLRPSLLRRMARNIYKIWRRRRHLLSGSL